MKDVPIGIDNFKKIRDLDAYYVDKTGLIIDMVSRPATEVFLFTRPRRFGKSMNMSMLDAFFAIDYDGVKWFDGLKVMSDSKCRGIMNSYPVISLSLNGLNAKDYEEFISDLKSIMQDVCNRYSYLVNWKTDSNSRKRFIDLMDGTASDSELKRSLRTLSSALHEYHETKAIILIDECDKVINGSYGIDDHERILDFMRDFLSNGLKGNDSLEFGVMTGVMQIAKESIFSGLNNLCTNNIFSRDFDEEFGFTENEVAEILSYYGHSERFDEVKEWYDGYRFGDADIYNPWSIFNYVRNGFETDSYWLNGGNPALILESMNLNGPNAVKAISDLYNNGKMTVGLDRSLTLAELDSMNGLLSLMTGSGYLKAVPAENGLYTLSLVNKEVRNGLLGQLANGCGRSLQMNKISEALIDGRPDDVRRYFENSLGSQLDSKLAKDERYYQAFMLGLLNCLTSEYYVKSEYRGGNGYADIAVIPRNGKGPFVIIELKDELPGTKDDGMRRSADGALEQIGKLRYYTDLHGLVRMYGIATRQTDVFVSYGEADKG